MFTNKIILFIPSELKIHKHLSSTPKKYPSLRHFLFASLNVSLQIPTKIHEQKAVLKSPNRLRLNKTVLQVKRLTVLQAQEVKTRFVKVIFSRRRTMAGRWG